MVIVLEGVDKAGKSTLAAKLAKELGWPIVHFGKPGPDPALEYAMFLDKANDLICDRFYVGELIYGPLLRGRQSMKPIDVITLERLCRLHCAILIHVNPPYSVIEKRLYKLGDDMITAPQNRRAYQMFKDTCPTRKFHLNLEWDGSDSEAMVNRIVILARQLKNTTDHAKVAANGIGTVDGSKFVFVGEQVNDNTTWLGLPFDRGPCAEYLMRAMLRSGIDEKKVYICNAKKLDLDETLFLMSKGEAQFIALGNVAWDRLRVLGIMPIKIPHPQYWKRFHYSDIEGYAMLIKKATEEAYIYNVHASFRQHS